MKKSEFISELNEALEHNLTAQMIKNHTDYYEEYIRSEVEKGRLEEDVVDELGDPWAIAKTIRLTEGMDSQETVYTKEETPVKETKQGMNWQTILLIIVLGIIAISLLSVVMGILGLVIRFAFPILIVVIIIQLLKRR